MCLSILNKCLRSFIQYFHIKSKTSSYKMHNNSYVIKSVPARHSMLADLADNFLYTTYSRPGLGLAGFYPGVIPTR